MGCYIELNQIKGKKPVTKEHKQFIYHQLKSSSYMLYAYMSWRCAYPSLSSEIHQGVPDLRVYIQQNLVLHILNNCLVLTFICEI